MKFNTFNDKDNSDCLFNSECEMQFLWKPLVIALGDEGKSVGVALSVGIKIGTSGVPSSVLLSPVL